MKIAILGTGPGAFSFAAYLCSIHQGLDIVLASYSEYASELEAQPNLQIKVSGKLDFVYTPKITSQVKDAISHAELILITVPAYSQYRYIEALLKYGKQDQYVLFSPGNFGALELIKQLRKFHIDTPFYVAEIETLPFASKFYTNHELTIKEIKKSINVAFFEDYQEKKQEVFTLFPFLEEDPSILKINIKNIGPPLHVPSTLLNASRIEKEGPYPTSCYDVTPSICHVMEAIDAEREMLANHFGIDYSTVLDSLKSFYKGTGDTLYDFLINVQVYQKQMSPPSLHYRYISEEVPYHFVPLVLLGKNTVLRFLFPNRSYTLQAL